MKALTLRFLQAVAVYFYVVLDVVAYMGSVRGCHMYAAADFRNVQWLVTSGTAQANVDSDFGVKSPLGSTCPYRYHCTW